MRILKSEDFWIGVVLGVIVVKMADAGTLGTIPVIGPILGNVLQPTAPVGQ